MIFEEDMLIAFNFSEEIDQNITYLYSAEHENFCFIVLLSNISISP
jgi:hypothetical protein